MWCNAGAGVAAAAGALHEVQEEAQNVVVRVLAAQAGDWAAAVLSACRHTAVYNPEDQKPSMWQLECHCCLGRLAGSCGLQAALGMHKARPVI